MDMVKYVLYKHNLVWFSLIKFSELYFLDFEVYKTTLGLSNKIIS
jgi:hypothetical protein